MSIHNMLHVHKHHPYNVHNVQSIKNNLASSLFLSNQNSHHIGIHVSRETIYILTLSCKFSVTITAAVETSLKYQKIDLV